MEQLLDETELLTQNLDLVSYGPVDVASVLEKIHILRRSSQYLGPNVQQLSVMLNHWENMVGAVEFRNTRFIAVMDEISKAAKDISILESQFRGLSKAIHSDQRIMLQYYDTLVPMSFFAASVAVTIAQLFTALRH
ncbi:hypothetical protein [Allosphingosinicella indica]|uniref:hypothetical protein n=1 Tax=Allosphingosinicella indica TaxID=941907 RepID=UPI0012F4DE78|nr:hypothetical protein [Allosphingosinicella indica]